MESRLELRARFNAGARAIQSELDALVYRWADSAHGIPASEHEYLLLADAAGQPFEPELRAPRWLCHRLGLRHRCAHVALRWRSPNLGDVFVLQTRSWDKLDSPGCLDISVGGHVKEHASLEQAAYDEMRNELGIRATDLIGGSLRYCGGYDSDAEQPGDFYNAEWRGVFAGDVASLDSIHFADGEVVGLYMCPVSQVESLLGQKTMPLASSLAPSLRLALSAPMPAAQPAKPLTLSAMPDRLAVCRMHPDQPLPEGIARSSFFSATRTGDELSIVCLETVAPAAARVERGWRALKVDGRLDFSLTGILASIAAPLADAGISMFAVSTYDTDYVLVKAAQFGRAVSTLATAGHRLLVEPVDFIGYRRSRSRAT